MISFPQAGLHGIRNLQRFSGRDSRSHFWFYALWLFVVQQVLSAVVVAGVVIWGFTSDLDAISSPPPSPADAITTDHLAFIQAIIWSVLATVILVVLLLAASVTRRLHDSDLRGWWGLMPLPFLFFGAGAMVFIVGSAGQPSMRLFGLMFINNAIYLLALLVLVILLCRASTPGPNRFGPPATG